MTNIKFHDFESISAEYLKTVDDKPIHCFYQRPHLLSLLPKDINDLSILDLGCGSGWYTEQLLARGATVTALDNSQTMVDYTLQRIHHQAKVIHADLEKPLDMLKSESFDLLIAPLVIHYIKDWTPLFKELARVLKMSGKLIFSTHQPQAEHYLFHLDNYYKKQQITDTWENVGKVSYYHHTLAELVTSLIDAGFSIEKWLEPQPLKEMQKAAPEMYEKITKNPWILFIRVVKVPS